MAEKEKPEDPSECPNPETNPSTRPKHPSPVVPAETEKEAGNDMARANTSSSVNPSWFTPKRYLLGRLHPFFMFFFVRMWCDIL